MKIKFILFIFSFCIASSSFSQKLLLLNSFFTDEDAVLVPQAEGDWSIKDFDMTVSIHKAGDNFYFLKYGGKKNQSQFEAVFVKINGEYFMDVSGIMPDSISDDDFRNSFIRCHTIYKVQFTKDTFELSELSYAWFYEYVMKRNLPLKYEWTDNAMLLTMKTHELKSFFEEQKNEKNIFEKFTVLTKKSSSITERNKNENISANKITENISQAWFPEFPFKDGWLGGDGDVSVPISKTQTLFIFSDTYVGNKNQQSRLEPGMKMVSNTVAVETCLPDGKTGVEYFWNNMYADNPQPVFKSFTNRYHYWVNDAFMYKTSLYVVLQKVAPKQGAAPDDFFGFSLSGITLAKITNPSDPPIQWKIELIPLKGFAYAVMGIHCHAIQDKFLYFFVSRNGNDNFQFFVRKKLDAIDNPEKPFEYYAINRTWKTGINADDMDTVINGFRANTVNYHSDIKQWVMVCDIKFLENKIKIRTASLLTGPWSEEKIVYEVPEVTPGTISYSKSNFCYLSRECIQNYDPKTHTMLITYDINNSSFSEINSNPKIYTPKVITVSLKKYGSR